MRRTSEFTACVMLLLCLKHVDDSTAIFSSRNSAQNSAAMLTTSDCKLAQRTEGSRTISIVPRGRRRPGRSHDSEAVFVTVAETRIIRLPVRVSPRNCSSCHRFPYEIRRWSRDADALSAGPDLLTGGGCNLKYFSPVRGKRHRMPANIELNQF